MWDLIKEFLEGNESYTYDDVDVLGVDTNGHMCMVIFKHADSMYETTTTINLWDVLVYVNNK